MKLFGQVQTSNGSLLAAPLATRRDPAPSSKLPEWSTRHNPMLEGTFFHFPKSKLDYSWGLLRNIPNHCPQLWMNMRHTFQEFKQAMMQMKSRKSSGQDNIPLELIKHGGLPLQTCIFTPILMWESWQLLKDVVIIMMFKKGEWKVCGNYRGISLLSITGKIFARILLNYSRTLLERSFQNLNVESIPLMIQST